MCFSFFSLSLVCFLMFIFMLLSHFCDKKRENIEYLITLLNKEKKMENIEPLKKKKKYHILNI